MREIYGDLWSVKADAICVTTNGHVNANGLAAMSAGCALEAAVAYPGISKTLGDLLKNPIGGNHVHWLGIKDPFIFSFPVKEHWSDKAELRLIERSARELVERVSENPWSEWTDIVIPRPGCGYGRLSWEEVKPVLEPILDDRFAIITWNYQREVKKELVDEIAANWNET